MYHLDSGAKLSIYQFSGLGVWHLLRDINGLHGCYVAS